MSIELRLLGVDGTQTKALPDVESLNLSPILCDAGTIEFQYPKAGVNGQEISGRDEFELAVFLDGERRPELDAIIKDVDGDDIAEDAVWKFTGFFNNGRLAEAQTYPKGWPDVDRVNPELVFTDATAGVVAGTLMQQAHSRGTLLDIDFSSFSGTHDSNGVEWDLQISLSYAPQVTYLDVLKNLYEQGLCEWQMVGKSLRLYVSGTMSVDRTTQDPPLVFRKGRDLADSPRKRTTRELATAYLTAGSEGLYHESVNEAAVAARRRIEGGSSQGNVSDAGTLAVYTDAQLERVSTPKMEKTHGLTFSDPDTPRPMRHFNVGDWGFTDTGVGLERLRIKQWVLKTNADGSLTGSVTLNDFFAEQDEKTAKRVSGIIGGSTIAGGSRAETRMPVEAADGIAPSTPQGLSVQSSAFIDASGQTLAQMTASWLQVTTNEDGTILEDFGRYLIEYQQPEVQGNEDDWSRIDAGTSTLRSWSPVAAGEETRVRVRAEDKWGNPSDWSIVQVVESGADAVPPPVPSTPQVDNYLGLLRVRWDGTFLNDQARPFDFARVEVHVSDTNFFEPSEETLVGPLSTSGSTFVDVPYGEVRYARLVAYDATGNASDPSDIASGTSSQVLGPDIFDGAVGSAKLADLAVITAKIADLAVNDAKIGSVSVGKLTAGIINAEVTISGRIATALTGRRVEMNGIGFQGWNATGGQTISLDGIDNLLTGRYRSALSGRRIEMGATGSIGVVQFYNADGGVQTISSSTFQGAEVLQLRGGTQSLIVVGEDNKMSFWGWTMHHVYRDELAIYKADSNLVDNMKAVCWIDLNGHAHFRPSSGPGGLVAVQAASSGDASPKLQLVSNSGYGGVIRTEKSSDGAVRIQFRTVNDNGWAYTQGASFDVMSDASLKEDIRDAGDLDLVFDQLMQVPLKRFRYKRERPSKADDLDPGPSREHIGVLAQDMPAELVSGTEGELGIDLAQLVFLMLAQQQRIIERLGDKL